MTMIWLGLFSGIAFGFVIQRIGATDAHRMARSHLMLDADIPRFMVLTVALSAVGLFGLQSVGVGRMDAVFALLGGLAGTALFAQLHETLTPVLYDPTNVGQITLTDLPGNHATAVAVLAIGFGLCTWGIGKLWGSGGPIVSFEWELNSETSPGNAVSRSRAGAVCDEGSVK